MAQMLQHALIGESVGTQKTAYAGILASNSTVFTAAYLACSSGLDIMLHHCMQNPYIAAGWLALIVWLSIGYTRVK